MEQKALDEAGKYRQRVVRVEGDNRQEFDYYLQQGWVIKSQTTISQGWAFGKTACLGCLFFPLALLGRKPDIVEYIIEKK